ncbi:hypothetical protein FD21_GL001292 [Liquorilactobacillus vini DSM 20605]|uniref:Uncharacterized protein n=3 Tax=Liquorilactobacillus vini TaxID=238015 RepID=A0A0R2C7H3_9LACO|nr:hypothetical protein FD21_GL001292 [Liquorilactobacillus vini DSM 20605]
MNIWISGYRNYELNIFRSDDQRIEVLKHLLGQQLRTKIEQGLTWVLTGGQLGIEQWTLEAALDLKRDYPALKIALILPFADFAQKWQPEKQTVLLKLKEKVDFCAEVSRRPYQSPQQLKNWQTFMLKHTKQALLVYDPEHPGKSRYDYQAIQTYQCRHDYPLDLLDFDWLQTASQDYLEEINENHLQ